jgi:putative transposase
MGKIHRLCYYLDQLQSRWTKVNHRKRYRYMRAARRIRLKIRNLVDEVHKKCTTWLCRNYQYVVIPVFNVSSMVRKKNRNINSKTVRSLLTWSHYRFRQRLVSKAREHPWCKIIVTQEYYTSRTCTNCGWIDHKLGSKKVFRCQKCPLVIDRDTNGARNILVRYLSLCKASV